MADMTMPRSRRLTPERLRWLWTICLLIIGLGALAISGIVYTNSVDRRTRSELTRVQDESQRDFCEMMRVFDDPAAPPPSTERGRRQVQAIRDYLARRC